MSQSRLKHTLGSVSILLGLALLAVAGLELATGRYISMPWSGILGVLCMATGIVSVVTSSGRR